jgi:hypothetical protein
VSTCSNVVYDPKVRTDVPLRHGVTNNGICKCRSRAFSFRSSDVDHIKSIEITGLLIDEEPRTQKESGCTLTKYPILSKYSIISGMA